MIQESYIHLATSDEILFKMRRCVSLKKKRKRMNIWWNTVSIFLLKQMENKEKEFQLDISFKLNFLKILLNYERNNDL